jgi:hypothetical protein
MHHLPLLLPPLLLLNLLKQQLIKILIHTLLLTLHQKPTHPILQPFPKIHILLLLNLHLLHQLLYISVLIRHTIIYQTPNPILALPSQKTFLPRP